MYAGSLAKMKGNIPATAENLRTDPGMFSQWFDYDVLSVV